MKPAVMPQGVEHTGLEGIAKTSFAVKPAVMPQGVEHLYGSDYINISQHT